MENTQDLLIMLLSTDWFSDCWTVLGLNLSMQQEKQIRQGCRSILNKIISIELEEHYYTRASMSKKRMSTTHEELINLFIQNDVAKSTLDAVENIVNIKHESEYNAQNIELLNVAMLRNSGEELGYMIAEPVLRTVIQANNLCDYGSECLPFLLSKETQAFTEWDLYIKRIHPEASLSHIAATVQLMRKTSCIWSHLRTTLTPSQLESLVKHYRKVIPTIKLPGDIKPAPINNYDSSPNREKWISIEFDSTKSLWAVKNVAEATDIRDLVIKLSELGYVAHGDDHMLWRLRCSTTEQKIPADPENI
jgi:hypothetical protein